MNRALVERYTDGSSIVGQQVTLSEGQVRTIVGIVGNVRHEGPRRPEAPEIYLPFAEAPSREMFFVLRSSSSLQPLLAPVRDAARTIDPLVVVAHLRTMDAVIEDSLMQPRQMSYVLSGFALLGLLLTGMGLYGVISCSVERRTREFGIRVAMGATAASIMRLVVREGLLLAAAGLVVGLPMAYGFARLLKRFLTFIGAEDVAVFAGVPLLVLAVAVAATYIPAKRATRVSPSVAMRCE